jgi:hypothetical protein
MDKCAKLLTPAHNFAVVQLPGRQYPGVVVQGDSLTILINRLRDAKGALQAGRSDEALAMLTDELDETLKPIQALYERVLAEHGIELPYSKA